MLRRLYQSSSVSVLSSRSEGSPNVLLEALASGAVVVATDVGNVDDILENGSYGVVVEPDSPRALADGLESVITDEQLEVEGRHTSACQQI